MPAAFSQATRSLARLFRDKPEGPCPSDVTAEVVEHAVLHGVAPLLYRALVNAGTLGQVADAARQALSREAREAVVMESVRATDLRVTLDALSAAGVVPLLFKGAALATTHYGEPWLRPRGDTDLLVRPGQAVAAGAVIERLGFRRLPRPAGVWVTQQARYVGERGGIELAYDLHWAIADRHAFATSLSYDELAAAAESPLHVLSDVHALLVACIHRVAHHYDTDTLILIYDIDRLARGLDEQRWLEFAELTVGRRLRAVSLRGLECASLLFETPIPGWVRDRMAPGPAAKPEPTSRYLHPGLRRIDILRSDLESLSGWRSRTRLIREHLFPPQEYMRDVYGAGVSFMTPLYLYRIAIGARDWFRRI